MAEVVIVGAGLTGLTAAYHLEKNNFYDFKIFEKENTPGGLLRSFTKDGFTFDFTGHLLHISNPDFYNFLDETAGIQNFLVQNRSSFIHTNNTFTDYPFQTNLYGLPEKIIYDVILGFINRQKNTRNPKNFHEWVLKHFGSGIGKHFLFPYNQKLLAYNIKQIEHSWTGRFVPSTNLKNIIYGALNKKNAKTNLGYNSKFYYPKFGGIQYLIDKLQNKIKAKINTNFKLFKIDLKNKLVLFENGHIEKFKHLISTMPLNNLLKCSIDRTNTNLQKQHTNLLCNSVINFNLGFNAKNFDTNFKNKHWIYFPEKKYLFYRLGFWNNICKNLAPNNTYSTYGEVSFMPQTSKETFNVKDHKQIEKLTENSINQTIKYLNINKKDILIKKTLILKHAYVIYNTWRKKYLNTIHKELKMEGINSIGRFGEWKYSSMQEAFIDGKNTAIKILHNMKQVSPKNFSPKKIEGLIKHEQATKRLQQ